MQEYRYTPEDRQRQLEQLVSALPGLIAVVRGIPELQDLGPQYEQALATARHLLCGGFNQEQLTALSRAVPDAFYRHKEWSPPLVRGRDGASHEPHWYRELEGALQPVLKAARVLGELGYY